MNEAGRVNLRNQAYNSGVWAYVEPIIYTPRWVHFDNRWVVSGYPVTRQGSRGPYVCIAQDSLTYLGFNTKGLDGVFGNNTRSATIEYQNSRGLNADGIIGPITWNRLMSEVVGMGQNSNVIN